MSEDKERKAEGGKDGVPAQLDAFLVELGAFSPKDAERIEKIDENAAKGDVDADPAWFARHLSERQIRYGLFYMESKGDFKIAAKRSGYSPKTTQEHIEEGAAMRAYMVAIKKVVADQLLLSATLIAGRFNRLALQAEERGNVPAAIQGNTRLAEMLGLLDKKAPSIHINADGAVINIGTARSSEEDDDETIDAVYREIAADNGLKALPEGK